MTTTLTIDGMHCPACVARLTGAFQRLPGVTNASVTLQPPGAVIESGAPIEMAEFQKAARSAGSYTVHPITPTTAAAASATASASDAALPLATTTTPPTSVYPLLLIVSFIAGIVGLTTFVRSGADWRVFMNDFMAGFFLVFAFFKLLDIRGFADAYQTYDILARRVRAWGFVYPFVELALGVAYLLHWQPTIINSITLGLMLLGSIGVLRAVLNKQRIRCACLGTALNLPMTTLTVVEDLGMAAMAGAMLIVGH